MGTTAKDTLKAEQSPRKDDLRVVRKAVKLGKVARETKHALPFPVDDYNARHYIPT